MNILGTKHENLDYKVYKRLKSMILERKLEPGAKISQDKLVHELGITRTPLVNALKKLQQEKLIKAIPRRGFYVRRFPLEEMIHIFELREVLEGLAARRGCLHIADSQTEKLKHFFKGLKISNDRKDLRDYAEEDRKFHHFLMKRVGTYNILAFSYHEGLRETGTSQCNIGVLEDQGYLRCFL